jgi:hypothetical protein
MTDHAQPEPVLIVAVSVPPLAENETAVPVIV